MKSLRKKTTATLLIAVFMVSMLTVLVPVSAVTEYYVTTGGSNTNDGSSGSPWLTIQHAVTTADSGATINVAAGTYEETVTIDKSLTLLGAKFGVDARTREPFEGESILDGSLYPGKSGFFIADGVSDVVIDGFEIRNYAYTSTGAGNAISVWQDSTSNVQILNNYMHDLGWNAILVGNEGQALHSNWLVENNLVTEFWAYGIELTNAKDSTIRENTIIGSTVPNADPDDISIRGIMTLAILGYMGCDPTDVRFSDYSPLTVSGNIIENNDISGTFGSAGINVGAHEYLDLGATNIGTIVRNNKVQVGSIGIYIQSLGALATVSDLQISGNELSGNSDGIQFNDFSETDLGTGIFDYPTIHVNYNNIVDNNVGVNYLGAGTLDATMNWWGHASGPSGENGRTNKAGKVIGKGGAIVGDVDWDPYLPQPVFHTPHHPVPPGLVK